jgi:hypothetical protein
MMRQNMPMNVTVQYDENLPNGAYAEIQILSSSGRIHCQPKMTFMNIVDAEMAALQQQMGMQANMSMVKITWTVDSVMYKGGAVNLNSTLEAAGVQNGEVLVIVCAQQLNRPGGCCTIV